MKNSTSLLAALLLGLPPAAAAQATRIDRVDADYLPAILAQGRDGSFWATGDWFAQRNLLVHHAQDGTRLGAREAPQVRALYPAPDGGVYLWPHQLPLRCEIERRDASGVARWFYRARGVECGSIAPDAVGNTWVYSRTAPLSLYFARLDRNGTLRLDSEIVQLGFEGVFTVEGSTQRAGFVAAGTRSGTAAIAEFDDRVVSRWVWQSPEREPGGVYRVTVAADGSITAAGRVQRGGAFKLLDVSLDANGAARRSGVHDDVAADFIHAQTTASDGANWILTSDAGNAMRVTRVGLDGTTWSSTPQVMVCDADSPCALRALSNGDVWQVGATDGTFRTAVLRRWTATGQLALERTTQNTKHAFGALLTGDVALLTVRAGDGIPRFKAVAPGGGERTPPGTLGPVVAPLAMPAAAPDGEGGTYVVVTARNGRGSALVRVARDGTERWRAATRQNWVGAGKPATNGSRVCLSATYQTGSRIECFATDDGAYLYSTNLAAPGAIVQPLADGNVVAWYNSGLGLQQAELDIVGGIVRDTNVRTGTTITDGRIDLLGNARFVGSAFFEADAQGTITRGPFDAGQLRGGASFALPDSQYVLVGGQSAEIATMGAYLPDGRLNWVRSLGERGTALVRSAGNVAWVATGRRARSSGTAPLEPTVVERFEPASGFTFWQRSELLPVDVRNQLEAVAGGARALLVQGWPGRVRQLQLDATSGATVRESFVAHAGRNADVALASVLDDGSIRTAFAEAAPGGAAWVATTPGDAGARGYVALDQAGIGGAWYPAYAPGQGIVVDWIASSRTLFAPWFTYSTTAANDPAQQRWYSLQGEVPAGATRAELGIYENTGGNFDAPPATTARRVGTASLELASCSEATLRYRFDAGTPIAGDGVIALTRLTPRSFACREADGTFALAQADASRGGFEIRQSGAWFDPATSGQGVMLTIAPGASLFGAWFTYDDAARGDDPTRQSWVTLQASLADATGGRVAFPLFRTAGGTFDAVAPYPTATWQVGEATLTFLACDRARLDYRFDDDEAAAPQRARAGSIALQRLGGCVD